MQRWRQIFFPISNVLSALYLLDNYLQLYGSMLADSPPLSLKEDFLGATVFTLAAASLQGETLLEREESPCYKGRWKLCFAREFQAFLDWKLAAASRSRIPAQCDCVFLNHMLLWPRQTKTYKILYVFWPGSDWTLDSACFLWWFPYLDVFVLVMFDRRTASLVWSLLGFAESNSVVGIYVICLKIGSLLRLIGWLQLIVSLASASTCACSPWQLFHLPSLPWL